MQKPTVDEVRAYCESRGNGIDPQAFVDFYDTCGWVQGRSRKPIKDWQACVRTWERNNKKQVNGQTFVERLTDRSWAQ